MNRSTRYCKTKNENAAMHTAKYKQKSSENSKNHQVKNATNAVEKKVMYNAERIANL
jgi:hypothetical protein